MPAYKDATTGKWYVQFWHTDYHGKKKKKMKRGFARKSDALKWEAEYKLKMAGSPDMTFASLTEHYLDDCRTRLKEMTIYKKESVLKLHILPTFGDIPIREIDARMVRSWQNDLIKRDFKPSHLSLLHAQLSAVFNYGIKYYGITTNPAKTTGTIGKANIKSMRFLTLDEFNRIIEQIADEEAKAILTVLFWTGARIGEVMAITWNDFDLEAKTMRISKTKSRLPGKYVITSPKTEKSNRIVTLSDNVIEMLTAYVSTLYDYNPKRQLFMFNRQTLARKLNAAAEQAGIKPIRIHDLRHSHASLLIEMGFPPLLISQRLGHENVTTTMNIYSHLYPNKQQDIADGLNNLKNGIKTESTDK